MNIQHLSLVSPLSPRLSDGDDDDDDEDDDDDGGRLVHRGSDFDIRSDSDALGSDLEKEPRFKFIKATMMFHLEDDDDVGGIFVCLQYPAGNI